MSIQDKILITKGVKSPVLDGPEPRTHGIGHVGLLDWDDHVTRSEIPGLLDRAGVGGPVLIFESSEGNLHGWVCEIRPFAKTAAMMDTLEDDGKHRAVGESRGWWRLRAGPKWPTDTDDPTDPYKPMPRLLEVLERDSIRPVSAPHLRLAELLHGETVIPEPSRKYELRGTTLLTAMYTTFKDLEKPIQRGAE